MLEQAPSRPPSGFPGVQLSQPTLSPGWAPRARGWGHGVRKGLLLVKPHPSREGWAH